MPADTKCKIFLACTSNLVSGGMREVIRFLVEHKMVDVLVVTAGTLTLRVIYSTHFQGGIEEDFVKCLAPTYIGDFALKGADLRKRGLNRIGNLLVPNDNYCLFEDWIMPIFDQMLLEQKEQVPFISYSFIHS